MIKIIIIIILVLLLFITLYSYYCLSSRMNEFERARLEYILNKENELNQTETKIKIINNCTEKNEKYQIAIKNINNIIDGLNLPPGSICTKYHDDKDKKTISTIKSIISEQDKNLSNLTSSEKLDKLNSEQKINIYNEVPVEFQSKAELVMEQIKNKIKVKTESKSESESESESESIDRI